MRVAALALALLVIPAGIAVAVPRSGSADDPRDVPATPPGSPPRADAQRVAVSYEPADGSLQVTLDLHDPLGTVAQPTTSVWVDVQLGLGAFAADGSCAVPTEGLEGRTGDIRFHGQIDSSGPPGAERNLFHTTVRFASSDRMISGAAGTISADRRRITWSAGPDPDLAGRDYRCAGDVRVPYSYHDSDAVADVALHDAEPPPAAAPAGGVTAVPPVVERRAVRDRAAPRLRFAVPSRSLKRLRASGMTIPVRCDERCRVTARLLVSPAVARALRTSRVLGTARPAAVRPGPRRAARLYLRPAAKRALAGRRVMRARLEVVARDRAGNRRTAARSLILRGR
ncbi:hypothetical protein [Miltoncostaea marina]|uniref:hypothetical protein n=1 Tax=Miltoncostaea marina TaxID=2843215 RepID=UPI001C3D729B|nr:hypothetical protein [Miltoncostaea marina]